ncbi:MAG TPA: hypothetical protein VGN26_09955 [Armatimonadota bacterium]|jgi:hypothetical protein
MRLTALGFLVAFGLAPVLAAAQTDPPPVILKPRGSLSDPRLNQTVTLSVSNVTLTAALDHLGKQVGLSLVAVQSGSASHRATLSLRSVPLIDVLNSLAEAYNLRWTFQGSVVTLSPPRPVTILPATNTAGAPAAAVPANPISPYPPADLRAYRRALADRRKSLDVEIRRVDAALRAQRPLRRVRVREVQ